MDGCNFVDLKCWRIDGMIEFNIELVEEAPSSEQRSPLKAFYESSIDLDDPICFNLEIDPMEVNVCARPWNNSTDCLVNSGWHINPDAPSNIRPKQAER
jgi:hypothetical protein